MPTPISWLTATQTNTGVAANESQSEPLIIGLSNGNFLVAWTESGTTGIGTTGGVDIIGKIFNAEGVLVRDSFRINSNFNADDERDFSIAPTNDGGFVIVYVDNDIFALDRTSVIWERHDATGVMTITRTIADENVAADFFSNPEVSVNLLTNESYISYTDDVGADTDINGVIVSAAGVVGAEFAMAQNSPDFDGNGAIAVLTGGNVVSLYREDDAGTVSLEAEIRSSTGAFVANTQLTFTASSEPDVAALSDGNWVAVWTEGNNVNYRIYGPTGATITGVLTAAGTADNENEPAVVGLPQGGFAIIWDNDTDGTLEGQVFTNAGTVDGSVFTVTGATTAPDIGVTADGRLLFTWIADNGSGEIFHSIMDPRGATINATDYDDGSRSFVDNTGPVTGNSLSNTLNDATTADGILLGQGGNDIFIGSIDAVNGDTFDGGAGIDTLDYTAVNFTSQVNVNLDAGTIDVNGGGNQETLISIENYVGGGNETIIGSGVANVLTGGAGNNSISGGFGDDTLNGGDGNDVLTGGSGFDVVNGGNGDDFIIFTLGHLYDNINGGAGNDTLDASAAGQALTIDLEAQTLSGFGSATQALSIETVIGTNFGDTITSRSGATVNAGGGDDLVFAVNGTPETLDGGAGVDTLDTTDFGGDYVVNLTTGLTNFGGETYTNFENLVSGAGNDTLTGTLDANTINGGDGNDIIRGGGGTDNILGGAGDDTVIVASGDGLDDADGGIGTDLLDYTGTFGTINFNMESGVFNFEGTLRTAIAFENYNGGDGVDTVTGTADANIINGNNGNDVINGGSGPDQIFGGSGDDALSSLGFNAVLDGGSGRDAADYSSLTGFIGSNFYWSIGSGYRGDTNFSAPVQIAFIDIEDFVGFDSNDNVLGTAVDNRISGADGNDWLRGLDGSDTLNGGAGNDLIDGGIGGDSMTGGLGDDIYYVDSLADSVIEAGGQGIDEVRTTANNYTLGANVENLRLQAGAVIGTGNNLDNVILAGAGPATLNGLGGNDSMTGSASADTMNGGAGDDFLFGRNGNDNMFGGTGNDTMRGEIGSDTMNGDDGNDLMFGEEGQDTLFGGLGDDDLRGGIQTDTLYGEVGADFLRGEDGNDNLYGGAGRDFFTGGAGNDNFYFDDGDFSGTTAATADRITDFTQGADRIRLNLVDAITGGADNAFTFIGTTAFSGTAGQLRYQVSGATTIITGDTNGDSVADFAIALTGAVSLVAGDFVL